VNLEIDYKYEVMHNAYLSHPTHRSVVFNEEAVLVGKK